MIPKPIWAELAPGDTATAEAVRNCSIGLVPATCQSALSAMTKGSEADSIAGPSNLFFNPDRTRRAIEQRTQMTHGNDHQWF